MKIYFHFLCKIPEKYQSNIQFYNLDIFEQFDGFR